MIFRLMILSGLLFNVSYTAIRAQEEKPVVIDEADAKYQGRHPLMWAGSFSYDDAVLATAGGWNEDPAEFVLWDLEKRQPTLIRRQDQSFRTAVFSPQGDYLATSDFAERIMLIDPKTGAVTELPKHPKSGNSLVFSRDSKQLLSGSADGRVQITDIASREVVGELTTDGERVVTIALSSSGEHLVAVTWQGHAYVWDYPNRKLLHKLDAVPAEHGGNVPAEGVAFAPDEEIFVTGSFIPTLRIWNARTGELIRDLKGAKNGQLAAAYSPDGNLLLTVGNRGDLNFWNPQTGELEKTVRAHSSQCTSVAFTSNGDRFVTTSWDKTAKIWSTETREPLFTLSREGMTP